MKIEISRPFSLSRNEQFVYDLAKLAAAAILIVTGICIGIGLVVGYMTDVHAIHP